MRVPLQSAPTTYVSVVATSPHELVHGGDDVGELGLRYASVAVHVVELEGELELVVSVASEELRQAY